LISGDDRALAGPFGASAQSSGGLFWVRWAPYNPGMPGDGAINFADLGRVIST
jgi:hypothetical protein